MTEDRSAEYKIEAKNELLKVLATVDRKVFASIEEIAAESKRNRNFISAFVNACVAFDLLDVKKSNSVSVFITDKGRAYYKKQDLEIKARN
ncbi:MAG: hypothetical protein EAX96_14230 [Candidatus Lokiarchaeota archaeon]|nr:hypothetical protein [Candidatus Lokiarchaeota archaeon]